MLTVRRNLGGAQFALLSALLCMCLAAQAPVQNSTAVNQDGLLVGDFQKQVNEYVKIHKKAEQGVPPLKKTDSAHIINEHRRLLATNIRAARPDAKQGAIFSPDVSRLFKRLIAKAYQSADPAKLTASLRHDEPVREVRVQVNAAYPEGVPLQTTPPSLLLTLPQLPPALDYRIVGRNLILRDTEANIIVDYIPAAIPNT
jgi:hypothetical protein